MDERNAKSSANFDDESAELKLTNELERANILAARPQWALISLMGHSIIRGRCHYVKIMGVLMLQVDKFSSDKPGLTTTFYSPTSVYSIEPKRFDELFRSSYRREDVKITINNPKPRSEPHSIDLTASRVELGPRGLEYLAQAGALAEVAPTFNEHSHSTRWECRNCGLADVGACGDCDVCLACCECYRDNCGCTIGRECPDCGDPEEGGS